MTKWISLDTFATDLSSRIRKLYINGGYKIREVLEAVLNLEPQKWHEVIRYCKELQALEVIPDPDLFEILQDREGHDLVLEVEVPSSYSHEEYLETVSGGKKRVPPRGAAKDFSGFRQINHGQFQNPSYCLKAGEKFNVRMVRVRAGKSVTHADQLMFLQAHRAVKPGAQGLVLLKEQHGDKLPLHKYLTNPDSEDHLVFVGIKMVGLITKEWERCQLALVKQVDGTFKAIVGVHHRLLGEDVIFFLWEKVK